ncbi:hypothetical protein E4U09_001249 [Claviceps aff. purpurea]|uniref:Uncharacterized protein n=1 Tax=Claviceps aff. purpurea TaxID=1967640 RepID=A0A9P7QMJ5_9HYPO|nr:hypothetical protein E4U09_001249 [Claviceps aff. purpurea]
MLGLPLQVSTHATPWYRRSGTVAPGLSSISKKGLLGFAQDLRLSVANKWDVGTMNSKEHNSYSTAAFARPSTEYDLMDGTVASKAEAEGHRRFLHICLVQRECHLHVPVMDGEWVPNGAKRVGEKLSCPASESQRKAGSEATSAAKVQADIEHSAAAQCQMRRFGE